MIPGFALCFLCEIYCVLSFLCYNKLLFENMVIGKQGGLVLLATEGTVTDEYCHLLLPVKIRLHFYQTYITIMLHKN